MLSWVLNPLGISLPSKTPLGAKFDNRRSCMLSAAQQAHTVPQSSAPTFASLGRPCLIRKEDYADIVKAWPSERSTLPFVYHDAYNVTIFGIEKLHPFDSCKFSKVVDKLNAQGLLSYQTHEEKKQKHTPQMAEPLMATHEALLNVHTPKYIDAIHSSNMKVVQVTELPPLLILPPPLLQRQVVNPMKYHAAGTMLAAALAIERGWSINLGGGMHHAYANDGMGWCMFDDVHLAIRRLRTATNGAVKKVLYIDLDVHQGNGVSRDKLAFKDEDLIIVDVFNGGIFPKDEDAWPAINISVPLRSGARDAEYLKAVRQALEDATQWSQPDLVFYNAGTDVLEGDPLGRFNISPSAIQQRDQMVFEHALHVAKAPIVMTLSGGYAPQSSDVISASLSNLIRLFQLNAMPGSSA
ncbi:hypothetical protein DUNSADRAFT_8277 [Dunaliella salina]|uniref:Histone deacetylase domain-containing protein n=1 Tax=Dunaliella salina TaxID=3046 RepID=A0ABQ7HA86_DUNSA|nr:hypothetical protein DUNSADRAFT_8277 [Dunaliella salina]|eukprot:KAF5843761.1 hypothetical protein DUNSADRAFT_8277 [Dunaliella salina]